MSQPLTSERLHEILREHGGPPVAFEHEGQAAYRKAISDLLAEVSRLREYVADQPSRFAAVVHQRTAAEAERDAALAEVQLLRRRAEEVVAFLTRGERSALMVEEVERLQAENARLRGVIDHAYEALVSGDDSDVPFILKPP